MKNIDKTRFHSVSMAKSYDQMCQTLVPGYDIIQDNLIDFIKFKNIEDIILLDLGAGSGILIEKILKEFPDSKCYYLDFSDDFLSVAQKKLHKFQDRVTYIKSEFSDPWEKKITKKPNLITSTSAIHHLNNENKWKLYEKCYNVLPKNGWFFNIDEMKTINQDTHLINMHYWVYHAKKQKETLSDDELDAYNGWMEKFDKWKERNLDNFYLPKKEGDDIHESFLVQLDWLNEIGFQETDLFCKYFLWGMIGGKKV